jgi:acetyl esterase
VTGDANAYAVPLDEVAADAVGLVRAFRDNGEISFQDVPLAVARANYLKACAANGLPAQPVADVYTLDYPVAGGSAALRVYRPAGTCADAVTALVMFIHGGGWVIGDLDSHDGLCRALANQSAATVIAVQYRLAPEHRFPIPLEDCAAALRYIADHAEQLKVDTGRLLLAGDSAGANMVTVLANDPASQASGVDIKGQVLFYPVTDLSASQPSYQRITRGFALTSTSMFWFREQYTEGSQDWSDARLSPLLHAEGRRQPPLFILTVGHDPLADEGIAYAATAARAGTHVEHVHLPAHAHGLLTSAGTIATGQRVLTQAAQFVARILS